MSARGAFGGLLLGIAVGAVLAILYAPEAGVKTRKRLAKKSGAWGEIASDALGSAGEFLGSAGDIVEKGRKRFGV